ncbi:MAG: DoxX family protein [Actinomycetota bacterium]
MKLIGKLAQTAAALWIINVWTLRFDKDTGYRGGGATNMKEEFEVYGFTESQMYAVGAVKVGLAGTMLAGHAEPRLVRPASAGLAMLMAGAIAMHIKAGDPVKRYLPALSVFSLATVSAVLNDGR